MFNRVEIRDVRHNGRDVLDYFTLFETDEDENDLKGWHLPVQAVATRAELFGLDSDEDSLEFLGRSRLEPVVEGEITAEVHPHYAEHLNQEALALEAGASPMSMGRTLMSLDSEVTQEVNNQLDESRAAGLQKLGVGGGRAMARMSGVTRASSVAMEATDEVVQRILEVCGREQALLNAWKLDMVMSTCPRIQHLMEINNGGKS